MSTYLSIFSSETRGGGGKLKYERGQRSGINQISYVKETNVCSNNPCHITKMIATSIYGKNTLKFSFLEPEGRSPKALVCSIEDEGL